MIIKSGWSVRDFIFWNINFCFWWWFNWGIFFLILFFLRGFRSFNNFCWFNNYRFCWFKSYWFYNCWWYNWLCQNCWYFYRCFYFFFNNFRFCSFVWTFFSMPFYMFFFFIGLSFNYFLTRRFFSFFWRKKRYFWFNNFLHIRFFFLFYWKLRWFLYSFLTFFSTNRYYFWFNNFLHIRFFFPYTFRRTLSYRFFYNFFNFFNHIINFILPIFK